MFEKLAELQHKAFKKAADLLADRYGGLQNIGGLFLSFVVAMIFIFVAVLIGGVFAGHTNQIFQDLNLTGTVWETIYSRTETFVTSGMNILLIGILIAAAMALVGVIVVPGVARRRRR